MKTSRSFNLNDDGQRRMGPDHGGRVEVERSYIMNWNEFYAERLYF